MTPRTIFFTLLAVIGAVHSHAQPIDYEKPPILYSKTEPSGPMGRLKAALENKSVALTWHETHGVLPSLLEALRIPVSSQVLTFSRTSLQDDKIGPATPRAIYFNDDIHLGFVQGGVIEIASTDPNLGIVFHTLAPKADPPWEFAQETNRCMTCHAGPRTLDVPGLQIRSVFTDPSGHPVLAAGSTRTNHATPFEKRWGGWYVTGKHGSQKHLGNFQLPDKKKPKTIDNTTGQNVESLQDQFDTSPYLSPHSDMVALMLLEHQVDGHNLMTRARFETRRALADRAAAPTDPVAAKLCAERIDLVASKLADYLLFQGEMSLKEPIFGTSDFTREFGALGPRDVRGRSLRDFDLKTRMFHYRCSYLVTGEAYRTLPDEVRILVVRHIIAKLSSPVESDPIETRIRLDTLAILRDLVPDFSP